MEATTETTRFCPMCAAPLRPRAVFCHRCGRSLPDEESVIYKQENSSVGNSETHQLKQQSENPANHVVEPVLTETPEVETNQEVSVIEDLPVENAALEENASVEVDKTAKPPRQRRRVVQTTEYVWEESNSDPTWRFALVTIIALIFVALILWSGGFIRF